MNATPKKRAVIVGVFIFLGLVFLAAGVLAVGNLHSTFVRKIQVSAIFDDVNGLQKGNNVWFSGVKIGTVSQLEFYGNAQVRVLFRVDEKAQEYIRKDAKVKLGTDGLIGNKILVIYGGTPQSPSVEDGDQLAIENLASTEEMLGTLQENNKNLLAITTDFKAISHRLAAGEGSLGKMLKEDALYNSLGVTLASLQRSSANAERLMASLSTYGNKLNQEGSLANELVTDTAVFKDVEASVRQLKQLTASASDAMAQLNAASGKVNAAAGSLDNRNSPLGVLLYDEQAADNVRGTLKNLETGSQKLDEDLRALQDNFLFRRYFKKKRRAEEKAAAAVEQN